MPKIIIGTQNVSGDNIVADNITINKIPGHVNRADFLKGLSESKSFVSFATEDLRIAQVFQKYIQNYFPVLKPCFVANTSVRYGDKWLDEIESALKGMRLFFIIFGPVSFEKHWLHLEAGAAWVQGVKIIPLTHSSVAADQLPDPYKSFQGGALDKVDCVRKLFTDLECELNNQLVNDFDPLKFVEDINMVKT